MLICVTPFEKEQLFQWAPIWKGVAENRRNRDFQSFGIARKACALKGERWRFYLGDTACVFYRLRGELAGTRRLGKEKKGEKVANLKEISYICSQIAIKIEDYGNDITVKPTTADTIVLELNTSFG